MLKYTDHNCNNCQGCEYARKKSFNSAPIEQDCIMWSSPRTGFPFPDMISRITTFNNPSKTQLALREFLTARV